jgi:hypothetical protein
MTAIYNPWQRSEMNIKFCSENLHGREHFERTSCRCEDNIKVAIKEIGYQGVDWNYLPQDGTSNGLF